MSCCKKLQYRYVDLNIEPQSFCGLIAISFKILAGVFNMIKTVKKGVAPC